MKDAHKYNHFNTILEISKLSPYDQFSFHEHTTKAHQKFNESREYRNLATLEVISRTPQSFPGFLSALNPAQLLSHVVIAPLPCHGADGTCCAVGAGRAAARGRQEPERHRRSAFPTQMQSRAPSA